MKPKTSNPESIVREIKRNTHRKFTAEEKIRIVLQGLDKDCISFVGDFSCWREGLHEKIKSTQINR